MESHEDLKNQTKQKTTCKPTFLMYAIFLPVCNRFGIKGYKGWILLSDIRYVFLYEYIFLSSPFSASPPYFRFYTRWKEWESWYSQSFGLHFSLREEQWQEDWAFILSLASQVRELLYNLAIGKDILICLKRNFRNSRVLFRNKDFGLQIKTFLLGQWC